MGRRMSLKARTAAQKEVAAAAARAVASVAPPRAVARPTDAERAAIAAEIRGTPEEIKAARRLQASYVREYPGHRRRCA